MEKWRYRKRLIDPDKKAVGGRWVWLLASNPSGPLNSRPVCAESSPSSAAAALNPC